MTGGSSTLASTLQARRSHQTRLRRGDFAQSFLRSSGLRGVPATGGLLAPDLDAWLASWSGVGARRGASARLEAPHNLFA